MHRTTISDTTSFHRLLDNRLGVMHARFLTHRYPRHAHDYLVVGLVRMGTQSYSYRGARHVTPAGQLFIVNPEEPHTGESGDGAEYVLQALYPHVDLLEELSRDIGIGKSVPHFKDAVINVPAVTAQFAAVHNSISQRAARAESESLALNALIALIVQCGRASMLGACSKHESDKVRVACEYMRAFFAEDVSLARLSQITGLNPYYLAHAFQREVGLPPHAYLETVRIQKARELLDRGESIASVALETGYADQAHFTKRFKRLLGITPGQYARARA